MAKYYTLNELLEMIDEPNRDCCKRLYSDNKKMFESAKGSKTKHQAWEGGYLDHVVETMNVAIRFYDSLTECRILPFSLSDALLVLYLHDLEKAWKYGGGKEEFEKFEHYQKFILSKATEYNFVLNEDQLNAIKYVHGEGDDYDPFVNIQGPLAGFVHNCDITSARIWHDCPKEDDSWKKS